MKDIYDNIPKFEDLIADRTWPKECEDYDCALLRNAPWLVEGQNLSMIVSKSIAFLDAVLYHIIESLDGRYPIRVFLTKKTEQQFERGLICYMAGISNLGGDGSDAERKRYDETVEKVKSFDLKYYDVRDWPVEDWPRVGEDTDFFDAVIIVDSFASMTTKATEKWSISRAVIGARLRDCLADYHCVRSVILFDQIFPGMDSADAYSAIESYADGRVSICLSERRKINNSPFHGLEVNLLSPARHGHTIHLISDLRTSRLRETWPLEKGQPSPDITELLF